ncbi:rhomboid family protein [Sphaerotilus hippei]|uniref:Rhomboid family protein n=1 Tax=Sphaerotilus hippei TaxID=744406 RepID=A0A318H486_9BURK|nr:rhomboid family intramembrane serine protease [Sphaerotilus hippei]PXW96656.1 rhomboid family protein [Sphaerotilus hippei]
MDTLAALSRGAPAAALLLAAIVLTSLAGLFVAPALIERNLLRPYWLQRRREHLTLITSGFIHADLGHLFFNGFTFWAFAFSLERHIGTAGFVLLYTFGLLVSGAGTWLRHRREPGYQCLGASGAILAVLFAFIVHFPGASLYVMFIPLPIPAPLFAVAYVAFSVHASRQNRGRVNHDAHLSGALAGVVFVAASDPEAFVRAWRQLAG